MHVYFACNVSLWVAMWYMYPFLVFNVACVSLLVMIWYMYLFTVFNVAHVSVGCNVHYVILCGTCVCLWHVMWQIFHELDGVLHMSRCILAHVSIWPVGWYLHLHCLQGLPSSAQSVMPMQPLTHGTCDFMGGGVFSLSQIPVPVE